MTKRLKCFEALSRAFIPDSWCTAPNPGRASYPGYTNPNLARAPDPGYTGRNPGYTGMIQTLREPSPPPPARPVSSNTTQ